MSADRLRPAPQGPWAALAGLVLTSSVAACPVAVPSTAGPVTDWDAEYRQAHVDYDANRWPAAYERLSRLADRGHPDAARMALLMWRHGAVLYGTRFDAAPSRREHWAAAASPCRST